MDMHMLTDEVRTVPDRFSPYLYFKGIGLEDGVAEHCENNFLQSLRMLYDEGERGFEVISKALSSDAFTSHYLFQRGLDLDSVARYFFHYMYEGEMSDKDRVFAEEEVYGLLLLRNMNVDLEKD